MRETTFDFERIFNSVPILDDDHVFVSGLARSGTTSLLNAIYNTKQFCSLSYNDMPFILSPNLLSNPFASKYNILQAERAHGDGLKISTNSPEAFEEVFWMTFDQNDFGTREKFKTFVALINCKYQKKRYLSKNNQNIRRLELLSDLFPNSRILVPFRSPIQQSYSLKNQHLRFLRSASADPFVALYMKLIGHTEFGPNYIPICHKNLLFNDYSDINHWLEQWILTYSNCYSLIISRDNIYPICYEELCSSKKYWATLKKVLKITEISDFQFTESRKNIQVDVNENLIMKASSLYLELKNCRLH